MNKKEQIIDVARNLFTTFGYKRVSMDEIALKAGVTKKTVYSYFKDKDELFEYFVTEELINMKKIIEKTEKKYDDTFERLGKVIYNLLVYKNKSKFLGLIANEAEVFKKESVIGFSTKIDNSIKNYIKEKLTIEMDKGTIKMLDVDLCTFAIYTLYISIMFNYSDKELDEAKISDTVMTILKTGLFN